MRKSLRLFLLVGVAPLAYCLAQPNQEPPQARSVHLFYAPVTENADAAIASINVTEVQTNTYYMILGWDNGYCGIQDVYGQRIFLFSVWEPGDPFDFDAKEKDIPENDRARIVYAAENVVTERFENEGTGAKTYGDIGWKQGETVSVKVIATTNEDEGEHDSRSYACFIKMRDSGWEHFATIATPRKGTSKSLMDGIHSFVEDFWRNGHSATLRRRAEYSGIATRSVETGKWNRVSVARFSADSSPNTNIDAGTTDSGQGFFLQTGGDTVNTHTPLWGIIELKAEKEPDLNQIRNKQ